MAQLRDHRDGAVLLEKADSVELHHVDVSQPRQCLCFGSRLCKHFVHGTTITTTTATTNTTTAVKFIELVHQKQRLHRNFPSLVPRCKHLTVAASADHPSEFQVLAVQFPRVPLAPGRVWLRFAIGLDAPKALEQVHHSSFTRSGGGVAVGFASPVRVPLAPPRT